MARFTDKQKAFINHYIITLNATESAREAGYKGNYVTLRSVGSENLSKPHIRKEIDRRLADLTMTADEVLNRVSKHASGTMEDFVRWDDDFGYRLDIEKAANAGKLDLVKKLKETTNTRRDKDGNEYITVRKEIELYPADGALDKLMRYYGKYNDSTTIKTWKDDIVQALIDGRLNPDDVKLAYKDSPDLVSEFFMRANVST